MLLPSLSEAVKKEDPDVPPLCGELRVVVLEASLLEAKKKLAASAARIVGMSYSCAVEKCGRYERLTRPPRTRVCVSTSQQADKP